MSNNQKKFENVYQLLDVAYREWRAVEYVDYRNRWEELPTDLFHLSTLVDMFNGGRLRLEPKKRTVVAYVEVSAPDSGGQRTSSASILKDAPAYVGPGAVIGTLTFEVEE
jgi:hypothetical protein